MISPEMYELLYVLFSGYIEGNLSKHRFEHSLGVSECAKKLASGLGADEDAAELAGLVHDITKELSIGEQERWLKCDNVLLTETEKMSPKLWHAITAPIFLRYEFNITDENILSAVRYHTTGKADMTPLEKAVYLADFISPDRVYPDVDEVRKLAEISVDRAILYTQTHTIRTLLNDGRPIHPDSLACYNQMVYIISNADKN